MCTVTIARDPHCRTLRFACNRDELHRRPEALPPAVRTCGRHRAVMPIDPQSQGTWIAANNAGLVATLLNLNLEPDKMPTQHPKRSRGRIIPDLMALADIDTVVAALDELDPCDFAPFRLVVTDGDRLLLLRCDGKVNALKDNPLGDEPGMFTSSGLGDHLVQPARRKLFDHWLAQSEFTADRQLAFHRHRWPDCLEKSIWMDRPDARSVSFTLVTVEAERILMHYQPLPRELGPTATGDWRSFPAATLMALSRVEASNP